MIESNYYTHTHLCTIACSECSKLLSYLLEYTETLCYFFLKTNKTHFCHQGHVTRWSSGNQPCTSKGRSVPRAMKVTMGMHKDMGGGEPDAYALSAIKTELPGGWLPWGNRSSHLHHWIHVHGIEVLPPELANAAPSSPQPTHLYAFDKWIAPFLIYIRINILFSSPFLLFCF